MLGRIWVRTLRNILFSRAERSGSAPAQNFVIPTGAIAEWRDLLFQFIATINAFL
jgi:hypothetical protein